MKKHWYIAGGALLALAFLLLLAEVWPPRKPSAAEEAVQAAVSAREREPEAQKSAPPEEETPEPYVSPVDFPSLQALNPDIYAWLYVPGTEINYPILQREGDDGYYLQRNSREQPDKNGSLFTESAYNAKDFSDPVTIVYGHHMRSGAMFGNLQRDYSAAGALEERGEIIVYLPETEIHYQAFAGVPYSGIHILHYYDFSVSAVYEAFLDQICSARELSANVRQDLAATPEDSLLILSTCLQGNNQRRYLVLAKRVDDNIETPVY